jgi:hypothetical protein
MSGLPGSGHGWAIEQRCRPTRPTGLGILEISEAGSAWPSTAAPDRGLGRPVAGRGRARIRGLQDSTVVDLDQGNYEMVTTRMQPSIIVWDQTVPDVAGFAAANDLVGKSRRRGPRGDRRQIPKAWLSFSEMLVSHALHCSDL